jgi:hypothetical protein
LGDTGRRGGNGGRNSANDRLHLGRDPNGSARLRATHSAEISVSFGRDGAGIAAVFQTADPERKARRAGERTTESAEGQSSESRMTSSDVEVDAAFKALCELFSSEQARRQAHRRCPIDGPSELKLMFDSIKDEVYGPDLEYLAWVDYLRREGLIFW